MNALTSVGDVKVSVYARLFGFESMPALTYILAGMFAAGWTILAWAMAGGFDLTDEAHYLIWAAHPHSYDWSFSEFGFLVHPFYRIVDGSILGLRLVAAAAVNICAFAFAIAAWPVLSIRLPSRAKAAFVLAIATASMWAHVWWIPSPGYNLTNLLGILLFMTGLALITPRPANEMSPERRRAIAAALVGAMGAVICALSRAPSAIASAIIAALWIMLTRPRHPWLFMACGVAAGLIMLVALAVLIDGSAVAFIERKSLGYQMLSLYGAEHDLSIVWSSVADLFHVRFRLADSVVIVAVTACLLLARWRWGTWIAVVSVVLLAMALAWWRSHPILDNDYLTALNVPFLVFVGTAVAAVGVTLGKLHWRFAGMAVLVSLAAIAFSVGTGNHLIIQASMAGVFFFVGTFFLIASMPTVGFAEFRMAAILSGVLSAAVVVGAVAAPYRLAGPIWDQTEVVEIGPSAARLLVDRSTATYVVALQNLTRTNGFQAGTPLIDLTGQTPGVAFVLGGRSPGNPWHSGGSSGSAPYVTEMLRRIPKEHLRRAWILTGPDGPMSLPLSVLQSNGVDFPESHRMLGTAFLAIRNETHILWRPK